MLIKTSFGLKISDYQLCLTKNSKEHLVIFKVENVTGEMEFFFILVVQSVLPLICLSLLLFIALLICQNVTR